jgi:hypothetical protein
VGPEQAGVTVALDTGPWGDALATRFRAVPIPSDAQPVAGQDHAMAVWQPSSDSYWEFFDMEQTLHAPQFARSPAVGSECGLLSGNYSYKLTSLNELGESSADAAPLTVDLPTEGGCLAFEWKAVSGATGYRIYRGSSGSPLSYLTTVPAGGTSFLDDGLILPSDGAPPTIPSADTPGEWHARFGGFVGGVSKSPGYYRDLSDAEGNVIEQSHWGAAATGLPLVGGLITKEDVERGHIDHALSLGLINLASFSLLRAGVFAFPAQRTDGRSQDPSSIPEGTRLRLSPSLDLGSLDLSPFVLMLAEAAQKYGMVVHDGSQGTVVYAEDPTPYVLRGEGNFYRPLIGRDVIRAMRGFPWSGLEVVQMHLCTQRPCSAG